MKFYTNFKNILLKKRILLILIFLLALILRLVAVFNVPEQYKIPKVDAGAYDEMATNIVAGRGVTYLSSEGLFWDTAPAYPLFLAGIYSIFGHSFLAARIVQSILGALLCVIVFFIAKNIFNETIGIISGLSMAIYKPFILHMYFGGPVFLLTENLFSFVLALSILYLIKCQINSNLKYQIIVGILLGLSALTRPIILLFPVFIFIWVSYVYRKSIVISLRKVFFISLFFVLTLAPWTIRNYLIWHEFIPVTAQAGGTFYFGNNPHSKGGCAIYRPDDFNWEGYGVSSQNQNASQRQLIKAGLNYLLFNYKKAPYLFLKKILIFWAPFDEGARYNLFYGIVSIFALIGIFECVLKRRFKNNQLFVIPLLLFFYFTFISIIFFGDPRFRLPIEPYIIIFASLGLYSLFIRYKKKMYIPLGISILIIIVNLLLYINSQSIANWISALI